MQLGSAVHIDNVITYLEAGKGLVGRRKVVWCGAPVRCNMLVVDLVYRNLVSIDVVKRMMLEVRLTYVSVYVKNKMKMTKKK